MDWGGAHRAEGGLSQQRREMASKERLKWQHRDVASGRASWAGEHRDAARQRASGAGERQEQCQSSCLLTFLCVAQLFPWLHSDAASPTNSLPGCAMTWRAKGGCKGRSCTQGPYGSVSVWSKSANGLTNRLLIPFASTNAIPNHTTSSVVFSRRGEA